MDKRTALGPDSILNLGGLDCCVEDVVGRGSNAIVYKGWYPDRLNPGLKHHVLIKELFPWHPTGRIYRSEEGTIVVERDTVQLWEDTSRVSAPEMRSTCGSWKKDRRHWAPI